MTTNKNMYPNQELVDRFYELAQKELWFQIQDELFGDNVKSVEPSNSKYLQNAEGKDAVRKKGEDWVKKIEEVHKTNTSQSVIGGNFFSIGREMDITVKGIGRIQIEEIIIYEVQDGKIVLEQFFY